MSDQFFDDASDSESSEIVLLFDLCARKILKTTTPAQFLDWIAKTGPSLHGSLAAMVDEAAGPPSQMFRTLGVAIYNAMPLPDNNFRARRLPYPGRNEPCLCGSGEKYKHCCLPLKDSFSLDGYNMLRHVLDNLPRKIFSALPNTAAQPLAVADTAMQWLDEEHPERAVALLEPWFSQGKQFGAEFEELFDVLMAAYLELGNARKRDKLIDKVLTQGDKTMRSVAMQRRSTMLADQGDLAGAWEAYTSAQRLDPDNPALITLELTLLLAEGQFDQARERAVFWLARLERLRNPEIGGLIEFLQVVRDDPARALSIADQPRVPGLDLLDAMLAHAPPLEVHHHMVNQGDGAYVLEPEPRLIKLEKQWRRVFPDCKPSLTMIQTEYDGMWVDAGEWLDFLKLNPLCWHSFEVLDDLALAVDAVPAVGTDKTLLEPLLARSVALLDLHLDTLHGEHDTLMWGWQQNRPALRSLAHLCFLKLEESTHDTALEKFVALAEKLMRLNPTDNHGIREALSRAYLACGQPHKAIALTDRYPDDYCAPALNRILALHCVGRDADAYEELAAATRRHSTAIKMLLARKPRQPRTDNQFGIALGGEEEAWMYRVAMLALWEKDGNLEWLKRACKSLL